MAGDVLGGRPGQPPRLQSPTAYGENIVARILDPTSQMLTIKTPASCPKSRSSSGNWSTALRRGVGDRPTGQRQIHDALRRAPGGGHIQVSTFTLADPSSPDAGGAQTQIKETWADFQFGLARLAAAGPRYHPRRRNPRYETAQLMVRAALTGHFGILDLAPQRCAGSIPAPVGTWGLIRFCCRQFAGGAAQRLVRSPFVRSARRRSEDP